MTKIRPYMTEPPQMPESHEKFRHLNYQLPPFMYKRYKNALLTYLQEVVAWAEKELNEARLFYSSAGNSARVAWIASIKPEHVFARCFFAKDVFDMFDRDPAVYQALEDFEQRFFLEAWQIWNFEKKPYETERREMRKKRPAPDKASLPKYDIALMDLAMFNIAYPGELTARQLTDAAIAGAK